MLRYAKRLASESLIYGVSGVISRLLFVFLVPVYTRVFSPEEYGEMGLVLTGMAVVSIFAALALDNAAHRWFWESEHTEDRQTTMSSWAWCHLLVASGFALLLTATAPLLAERLLDRRGAAPLIVLSAWALPLTVFSSVVTNWFRLQRRAWATVLFTIATSVSSVGFALLLVVHWRRGVRGVFEGQLLSAAVASAVALVVMRGWLDPRRVRLARLLEMLRYGLPLIPAAVAFWAVALLDRWFVQHYTSTAEVGLYQVGAAVAGVVALGTTAFQQAWGPFALSIHRDADARRFYATALLLYLWVACAGATAVSLFAPEILHVFTTSAYTGAAGVVGLLAFGYVMMGLSYVASVGPSIVRLTAPIGIAATAAAVANVALNFLLVPRLGKQGAALATLVAQGVVPVYLFWRGQKRYPIPYRFGAAFMIVAASGGVVLAGALWQPASTGVAVAGKLALLALFLPMVPVLGVVPAAQLRALGARMAASRRVHDGEP